MYIAINSQSPEKQAGRIHSSIGPIRPGMLATQVTLA